MDGRGRRLGRRRAFIAFVALDGKDRPRTLTLSEYVTDLAKVSDDQLRSWLEQAAPTNGQATKS
jgi:hypothetical protein